jgi:DNA-binding IclR family transcriptional regulator
MKALELLAFQPLSAPQVAAALQVHPRTARRLLNRLRDEGYLCRSDGQTRLYAPTTRIVALAGQVLEHVRLARRAVPLVAMLHEDTGFDAHLMIPSYRSVLCVVHAGHGIAPRPGLHELAPCHCTATGKVLLGYRQAWRDSVLRGALERQTPRTTTDRVRLRAELDGVRERGHALEDEEHQRSIRGAAAPVFGPSGEAIGALGVTTDQPVEPNALAELVVPVANHLAALVRSRDDEEGGDSE